MNRPYLSIIVPVYNGERWLKKCIESILNQTLREIELILIDDCSKDSSGEICDAYKEKDDRVIVIHNEKNIGGGTRAIGLGVATGEYIGFVDNDDWIDPDMYSNMLNLAWENNADVVICGYRGVNENTSYTQTIQYTDAIYTTQHDIITEIYDPMIIWGKLSPVVWNKIYKSSLFRDNRCEESMSLLKGVYSGDWMMNAIIMKHAKRVVVTSNVYYNYLRRTREYKYPEGFIEKKKDIWRKLATVLGYFENETNKYENALRHLRIKAIVDYINSLCDVNNKKDTVFAIIRKVAIAMNDTEVSESIRNFRIEFVPKESVENYKLISSRRKRVVYIIKTYWLKRLKYLYMRLQLQILHNQQNQFNKPEK